jgi:hypothetical protein
MRETLNSHVMLSLSQHFNINKIIGATVGKGVGTLLRDSNVRREVERGHLQCHDDRA